VLRTITTRKPLSSVARSTLVVTAWVAAGEAAEAGAVTAAGDGVAEADGPAPEAQP
jgi:hypothetical protein